MTTNGQENRPNLDDAEIQREIRVLADLLLDIYEYGPIRFQCPESQEVDDIKSVARMK